MLEKEMTPSDIDINEQFPILRVAADASAEEELQIVVNSASYDADTQTATIKLKDAFSKKSQVDDYNGEHITMVYNKAAADLEHCPEMHVSLSDVERTLNFFTNTVTLEVSNITAEQAKLISDAQCFKLDTDTVKAIVAPGFNGGPKI